MRIPADSDRMVLPSSSSDVAALRMATWPTGRPWLWAIVVGVAGTLLTAFGVGFSQVRHLDPVSATYAQAAFIAVSALVGFAVMWRTRPSLAEYGFRIPQHVDRTLWLIPLFAVPVILIAFSGISVQPAQVAAYAALAVGVGFNEEIWFRGLLLATVRRLGVRTAIIGASAIFGALHLTNFFAGLPPLYLGLQFAFACLVGFVLAEIVAITGSLWIGIGWHAVYDLAAFCTGNSLSPAVLAGVATTSAVLAGYSVWLWRRLPTASPSVTLEG